MNLGTIHEKVFAILLLEGRKVPTRRIVVNASAIMVNPTVSRRVGYFILRLHALM